MKILQIVTSLNTGGAEKLLLDVIPKFNKQQAIKMDLALLDGRNYPFLNQIEQTKSCKIWKLSLGSPYNPLLIFKIIKLLKVYDLVHVHLFPTLYLVALAKLISFSKTPLIYTEHSTSNKRRHKLLYKYLDQIIYKAYSNIITISKDVDNNIKKHLGYHPSKFCLIQNGIDIEAINNTKPLSRNEIAPDITKDNILIVQVSSFRYPKDQKTVIKTVNIINNPKIKLILIGEGPLKKECMTLVSSLNLENQVYFLGTRNDVFSILKTVNIVVLASHHEGLSLSCIEGMASGKAFIASDTPGLGDIVKHHGLVFPDADAEALATHIKTLINDSVFYKQTVANCLKRASDFDIHKMIQKHITLYKTFV